MAMRRLRKALSRPCRGLPMCHAGDPGLASGATIAPSLRDLRVFPQLAISEKLARPFERRKGKSQRPRSGLFFQALVLEKT